jgi:peroxiredoxin
MFCREQAVQLHGERKRIRAAGAELHLIGNGNRHFAKGFRKQFGISSPLWIDTELESYAALGLKRGFFATLGNPSTLRNAARALGAGFRQGRTQGDALQLGGVYVVRPGGAIAFEHRSQAAGDHPSPDRVLASLGS